VKRLEHAVVIIAGSIRIDPTARDELISTAIAVVRELRKQVGCTQVTLSSDLEDPGVLHLFQTWESQEALSAAIGSRHIDAVRDHEGRTGVREMALLKYAVASVGRLV